MSGHIPVLLNEAVASLEIKKSGTYIDATFGRGGHSKYILEQLGSGGKLIVIDKDPSSIELAKNLAVEDPRLIPVHGSYKDIGKFVSELNLMGTINGVLLDLGISSFQLDSKERGFSFLHDGPLDMRMDPSNNNQISAKDWVNQATCDEIKKVLREYGEEKFSGRIALAIVEQREVKPFSTTKELSDLIQAKIGKREKNKHPATRSFQAIRIYINNELQDLEIFLEQVESILAPKGRIAIISFHSLEDRIVKRYIQENSKMVDNFPKNLPVKHDMMLPPKLKKVGRFTVPSTIELDSNIRSRSAKLRIAEKIGN